MTYANVRPLGNHLLADLHGVDARLLSDTACIDALLRRSAEAAGAHILGSHFHAFGEGQGVTGVLLLAESHISVHTWPEFGFVAVDIFMCGSSDPERALEVMESALKPASCVLKTVTRGGSD